MKRTQFTFYESFFTALKMIRKKPDRADAYDAIINYALYGTEPDMEKLPETAAIAFELIRPNLDASRRKAENGKRGGEGKKSESKQEANGKQEEPESKPKANLNQEEAGTEKEDEKEKEKEDEYKCSYSPTPLPPAEKANPVLSYYRDKVNPTPSESCLVTLQEYAEDLGVDVCKKAIDVAIDDGKASWSYIRAILADKRGRGIRTLADWDRAEEQRKNGTRTKGEKQTAEDMNAEMWKYVNAFHSENKNRRQG